MMRAIVLAHFDPHGRLDEYVLSAIREYRRVADRLVVVSAGCCDVPREARHLVDLFICRDNVGYDFCSWREGIRAIGPLSSVDELICVNDSVYGPVSPIGPALEDARVAKADVWGMCMSIQGTASRNHGAAPHLQSWFVAFRHPVLQSRVFREFWRDVRPLQSKAAVIDEYEIGLSERLLAAGIQLSAIHDARTAPRIGWQEVWPMLSLRSPLRSMRLVHRCYRHHTRQNPAELRPLRLIRDGVPFLKSSVFRVNHYSLDLPYVSRQLERLTGYDMDLVRRHQSRLSGLQERVTS